MTTSFHFITLFSMQFVITVLTFSGIAFASSSSEEEEEEDDAVQEAMDAKHDQTKEMAEEAIVNGTCLPGLEIMKILAHPDSDVAILGTEIPTCGPGF